MSKLILLILLLLAPVWAQSTDPDKPSALSGGQIEGTSTGGLSDTKTYYYAFDVVKGTLSLTLDVTPQDQKDGGGLVAWTLLTPKFQQLKYDNLAAQGTPGRQVKEMPVTIKRRIILKLEASGNIGYKLKFGGSALK